MIELPQLFSIVISEVKKAFFGQDNAGCYHSTATILSAPAIERESEVQVIEVGFSDPQGGKGLADRMAATVKGHISRFLNEGNNVTNVKEMEKAILTHGGLPGIWVAVIDRLDEKETLGPQQKIARISKLNNFSFSAGESEGLASLWCWSWKEIFVWKE